ncbi:META domain-containing protein [Rubrobacter tropicus]|uniref:META domain-containing protein n=1 Tax=Rubrobacter tropicus TaxID=2653851 RepID=A0A6G8Q7Y6_9ACTN|nr:META domain-containing protein [Rubrobacter tropicus]QIN82586.1 META domain-containing protein [Rubrobacter tropicus]
MWVRALLVTAMALVAACGNTDASDPTGNTEAREESSGEPTAYADTTASADERVDLSGTKWALTELEGRGLIGGTQITLNFRNDGLAGNAGCNFYRAAEVRLGNGTMETSTISATEMACGKTEGGVMDQEQRYLRALGEAASYRLVEDRLEIQNGAGEKILLFEKEKA